MVEWYIFMIENLMKLFTMAGQTEFRAYMVTGYFLGLYHHRIDMVNT